MSKIFLTIEEASERLGKSVEEVQQLITEGKLQEFKQDDQMMVKSEQVEIVATSGGLDDSVAGDQVSLEDSFTDSFELDDASSSGSAIGLADSNEATGISAFDTALGQEAPSLDDDEMNLETFGSESQLLDLTRESDDSMAGAELMNQSFEDDDQVELPASASGIFKRMEDEDANEGIGAGFGAAPVAAPMIVEEYDGAGSGMGLGAMIAASLSLVVVGLMVVTILSGGGSNVAGSIAGNLIFGLCIPLVVLFILLGVGFVIGRATD